MRSMKSSNTDEENKVYEENEGFSLDAGPRHIIKKNTPEKGKRREFSIADAEYVACGSKELSAFQKRHPSSGFFVKMSPEESEAWIKAHPDAFAYKGRGRPPKIPQTLWQLVVSWGHLGKWLGKDLFETITITMNPISRKIVETKEERIIKSSDEDDE